MPAAQDILDSLARAAGGFTPVAIAWHVAVAAALGAVIAGWRPSRRLAGCLLALPLLSVSATSAAAGNPFNTLAMLGLAAGIAAVSVRLPSEAAGPGPRWSVGVGAALAVFGLVFPHFLPGRTLAYLYSAPAGLIPCPSLSLVLGAALMLDGLRSSALAWSLAAAGAFYGLLGALWLHVRMDLALLAGAGALASLPIARRRWR